MASSYSQQLSGHWLGPCVLNDVASVAFPVPLTSLRSRQCKAHTYFIGDRTCHTTTQDQVMMLRHLLGAQPTVMQPGVTPAWLCHPATMQMQHVS
jgi:hypothetical protein